MKRIIYISVVFLFTIAAQAHPIYGNSSGEKVKKKTIVKYTSLGNDFAQIKMEMFDNGKFIIRIEPKDGKSLKLKGRWEKKGSFYLLNFKRSHVAVSKLFNMNDPNRFEVLDDENVKFSGHLSSLWIWGIQCKRIDST